MKRSNAEFLLRALEKGLVVEIDGSRYTLGEDSEGAKILCIVANCYKGSLDGPKEEKLFKAEIDFSDFLKLADKLTEDDRTGIAFTSVMKDMGNTTQRA